MTTHTLLQCPTFYEDPNILKNGGEGGIQLRFACWPLGLLPSWSNYVLIPIYHYFFKISSRCSAYDNIFKKWRRGWDSAVLCLLASRAVALVVELRSHPNISLFFKISSRCSAYDNILKNGGEGGIRTHDRVTPILP